MARIIYTDMSGIEQTITIGPNYPLVTIGRAVDCDIRSNRKSVSRHHAEFKLENNQVHVVDLKSSNGTFVIIDDQRHPISGKHTLTDRDEVWCGDFVLRYHNDNVASEKRPPIPTFTNSPELNMSARPAPSPPPPIGAGLTQNPPAFGGEPRGLLEQSGFEPLSADIEEIERLMAEKSSIEELATRQAAEIERLETLVGTVQENAASSAMMFQNQCDKTEAEKERLREQIAAQKSESTVADLEKEVVELRALNEKLRLDLTQSRDEIKASFESLLARKTEELDQLGQENARLGNLNNDITSKLEAADAEISDLKSELNVLAGSLSSNSHAQNLENEWEAKFAAENYEKEVLQATVDELRKEKEELESNAQSGSADSSNEELVSFLKSLERLTDAIQRTDFSVLSTVDRVRLQSAIRETDPKATLQAFIEKNQ